MDNLQKKKSFVQIKKYLSNYRFLIFTVLFVFLFLGQATVVRAASIFTSPASVSYEVGKTFSISVFVSSKDQAMNAASGSMSFPADKLEVTSISKGGSIFSLWAQEPTFSNSAGNISFEGIVMNPGFSGASGKIVTVNFKTKAVGQASISFSSASILANDGLGTNILKGSSGANINIAAAEVKIPTDVKKPEVTTTDAIKNNGVPVDSAQPPIVENPSKSQNNTSTELVIPTTVVPENITPPIIERPITQAVDITGEASHQNNIFGFDSKFYQAGSWLVRFLILLIPIVALLLLLIFMLWYGWHKFHQLKMKALEEMNLARRAFKKELLESKKDIQARIDILERNHQRRQKVEAAEAKILAHLNQELLEIAKSENKVKYSPVKRPTARPITRSLTRPATLSVARITKSLKK